jgi:excisionase family DNA binding protein
MSIHTTEHESYCTVAEVARTLRVSEASIYRAVQRGDIESVRLAEGGAIRIPARIVDDALAAPRRSAP